jgi:hypothetical protein
VVALGFAAVGSGLILYTLLVANYVRAWQIGVVFVSTAGTILFELFESGIPNAVPGVDYPALAVAGVGVSYLVGLCRYDLFGYTPVDMADVIDSITAPVVVLNPAERVTDNGPGIPDNELTVLDRGRETMLEHDSGIGLWIVNLAVDENGGTVHYEVGDEGSTIRIRLPSRAGDGDA